MNMNAATSITHQPLSSFPADVQADVLDTLKAYSKVYVTFQRGEYTVSAGISITNGYAADHKHHGHIEAADVYTENERTANYIECFRDYPIWYKGRRDYRAMNDKEQRTAIADAIRNA